MLLIFSFTVPTPRLVRVFAGSYNLCLSRSHEWHANLHINIFEHLEFTRTMHPHPSMSSLIMGSTSMFTCLKRRLALASFLLSCFLGTPMQSDPSFYIWSIVSFSAIVIPGCFSSLHIPGWSHYPGSWGWCMDSIPSFSHSGQQSPPQHLHMIAGPLQQFGLQVYGLQPGWLELSHRVDLMSKCPFVLMPKAAAWHAVTTQ